MPAVRWNSSVARCSELPAPGDGNTSLPGSRRAISTSSCSVPAGYRDGTTSTTALSATSETGANDSSPNGSFAYRLGFMPSTLPGVSSSWWPSGVAWATAPAPMLPPAPGRLSTVKGCTV